MRNKDVKVSQTTKLEINMKTDNYCKYNYTLQKENVNNLKSELIGYIHHTLLRSNQ
jgi:hypothetical protein